METEGYILALILSVSFFCAKTSDGKYRICVTERLSSSDDCHYLDEEASEFICIQASGATDCALKLDTGEADFGIFTAEEVILASTFDTKQQRIVIAEVRLIEKESENFQFETVAIVEENSLETLQDLRGKKFCHPGFYKSQVWTDRVLKHFESVVLKANNATCVKHVGTAAEDELHNLASFFASSCRPGEWADDGDWDKKLKRKYSTLCELCELKGKCSHNLHAKGNQYAALDCLTHRGGDVAYVEHHAVKKYFSQVNGGGIDPDSYRYLCPKGHVQTIIKNERPCTWLKQPWDSIIVKDKETAAGLAQTLESLVPTGAIARSSNVQKWKDALIRIICGHNKRLFPYADNKTSLKTFIKKGWEIPENVSIALCNKPIKWCTTSEVENNKCEWLHQAAIIQGMVSELQCVQGTSHLDCFEKIKMGKADIVGTNSNLGPIATQ